MDFSQTAVIRFEAKQTDRLFSLARLDCISTSIGAFVVLAVAWIFEVPKPALALPLLPFLICIARWIVALSYERSARPSSAIKRWNLIFNIGAFASGLSWGVLAAYYVYLDLLPTAVLGAAVTAVMALCAAVFYAGSLVPLLLFAVLALAPSAGIALYRGDQIGIVMCMALVSSFIIAVLCSRVVKHLVWDFAISQSENEQLVGHLDQRRTQVEKLNVALKTNTDKREQAEITLRRTAADLGLVQGKAKALATTLERVSPVCQVTGLANRRHFDEQFESEWRRATREQKPMSLVIVEVDDFEAYVTSHGSQASDSVLKRVAQSIKGFGRRSGDLAGRFAEDRLALMLPGCDARDSTRMADALRKRVETLKIAHSGAKNRDTVTIHVGVATIKPTRSLPNVELIKRSDAALYEARFQGGNKVVAYKPLSKLKLERWDQPSDGPLSEQSLTQKLLVWGYDTAKDILRPGDKPREHLSDNDTIIAPLTGELLIDVEGHTMSVKGGDSVFVPNGVALLLQAAGENPVIKFTATKSR